MEQSEPDDHTTVLWSDGSRIHVALLIRPYPSGTGRLFVPHTPVSRSPSGKANSVWMKSGYDMPVIASIA